MKKLYLFFIFIIFLYFSLYIVFAENFGKVEIGISSSGDLDGPNISLIYPLENISVYSGILFFNYSASDVNSIDNCSLIINGENVSTAQGLNNSFIGNISYSLITGEYLWQVGCYDSNGNYNETNAIILNVIDSPVSYPYPSSGGGGGGSGGGGLLIQRKKVFDFNEKTFSVKINIGSVAQKKVIVHNFLNKDIEIDFETKDISEFYHSPKKKTVKANSSDIVIFEFAAGKDIDPGIYIGKIIARAESEIVEIISSLEIESPDALFDVGANVPIQFKEVKAGESISAEVELFNFGEKDMVDVLIEYGLKDVNGNIIIKSEKTIAVKNRASFITNILIPNYVEEGDYFFYVQAYYDGKTAVASDNFKINSNQDILKMKYLLLALFIIVTTGILIMIIYFFFRYNFKNIIKRYFKKNKKKR